MEQFSYPVAISIILITLIIVKISLNFARTGIEKLYIIFLSLFTLIYSGLGISFQSVSNKYIFSFILFIIFLVIGLNLGFRVFRIKRQIKFIDSFININRNIINIGTIIYWSILLFRLIYPINRLPYLFSLSISVNNVFGNQILARANTITYILGIVLLIIRPLYYIYLFRVKSNILPSILIFLEVYIGVVIYGYIGRSGMIVNGLLILFVYVYKREYNKLNNVNNKKSLKVRLLPKIQIRRFKKFRMVNDELDKNVYEGLTKTFAVIICILLFMLPLLFDYQYYRLGVEVSSISITDKINNLFEIEFGFPKLYDYAEQFSSRVSPFQYLKWLITLIVPKQILPISDILLINYEFSTSITGIKYSESGFYVFLPSILGEGIMLYGWMFSFVHGLVLGYISGLFCSFYQKSKVLSLWNIYLLFQLLLMPRGGSQGTISMFVNSSVILILCVLIERSFNNRTEKF